MSNIKDSSTHILIVVIPLMRDSPHATDRLKNSCYRYCSTNVNVVHCLAVVADVPTPNATVAEGCPPGKYNWLILVHGKTF